MSNADVLRAKSLFDDLLGWELRGPGDLGRAMTRLATRYQGLTVGKLWALRYRPPKEIASHVLARIEAAHTAEKQRQLRKLAHETALTARVAGSDHPAVRAGEALLRAAGFDDPSPREDVALPVLGAPPRAGNLKAQPEDLADLPLWRAMTEE